MMHQVSIRLRMSSFWINVRASHRHLHVYEQISNRKPQAELVYTEPYALYRAMQGLIDGRRLLRRHQHLLFRSAQECRNRKSIPQGLRLLQRQEAQQEPAHPVGEGVGWSD